MTVRRWHLRQFTKRFGRQHGKHRTVLGHPSCWINPEALLSTIKVGIELRSSSGFLMHIWNGFVTLAKSQFQHIPWNIKKRWIWWICRPCLMQFRNYTKDSNDWEFTSENKSSRTTWKRSLRSPRFLGRTVSLSNRSLQSPSAGPYTSFMSTMHESCIHNFEG